MTICDPLRLIFCVRFLNRFHPVSNVDYVVFLRLDSMPEHEGPMTASLKDFVSRPS
jgi:hypothetical protein